MLSILNSLKGFLFNNNSELDLIQQFSECHQEFFDWWDLQKIYYEQIIHVIVTNMVIVEKMAIVGGTKLIIWLILSMCILSNFLRWGKI